jgi:hypothetical protein
MKQRRLKREHGRIMSVETKTRGDALAEDAAAAATTLVVGDAGDFDEDGGWLLINDQVVEYLEVDDDESTITLAEGLDAAGSEGDAVHVWSTLYDEVVDYQEALVEVDGEYDNPEPVVAEVAEGVGDLPEGDRGAAGESCTLLRVSDDEWEIVGVGGRSRKSKSIRFEADDVYVLTADDVTAGVATFPLSHRPIDESVDARWRTVSQEPTEYTVNYDAKTITWPLDGFEQAGDRIWVHYAYRKGVRTNKIEEIIGFDSSGWKYLPDVAADDTTDRSAPGFDDSSWATGTAPINWTAGSSLKCWLRRKFPLCSGVTMHFYIEDHANVYVNGQLVIQLPFKGSGVSHSDKTVEYTIPESALAATGENTLAIEAIDDNASEAWADADLWGVLK